MFFKKKTKQKADKPTTPYVECRSWHGVSFHIRDTRNETGKALCGYEPLDDRSPVTLEDFNERSNNQHEGWKYCRLCSLIFTFLHDDEKGRNIIETVTPDGAAVPGRWCDRCKKSGFHHTDRHDAFLRHALIRADRLEYRWDK